MRPDLTESISHLHVNMFFNRMTHIAVTNEKFDQTLNTILGEKH